MYSPIFLLSTLSLSLSLDLSVDALPLPSLSESISGSQLIYFLHSWGSILVTAPIKYDGSSPCQTWRLFWEIVSLFGARGVMVIVVGSGHGDTSSNPGRD